MTYKGRVRNGAIVLDSPVPLPDGAQVEIELIGLVPSSGSEGERRNWRGAYRDGGPVPSEEDIRKLRQGVWPQA